MADDALNSARSTLNSGEINKHMAVAYEYRIIVSDDDDTYDEQQLNDLGAQGWELVSAIADVRAGDDTETDAEDENIPVTVFYLKRAKSE